MASSTPPLSLSPALSPDDLDALSELALVLDKVRAGLHSAQTLAAATSAEPSAAASIGGPPDVNLSGGGGSGSGSDVGTATGGAAGPHAPLSFKDVPGATDRLKHKLQHARAEVRALPDMDRSVEQQRAEMGELEARIAMQRALLERLRDGGLRFSKDASAADKMEMGL